MEDKVYLLMKGHTLHTTETTRSVWMEYVESKKARFRTVIFGEAKTWSVYFSRHDLEMAVAERIEECFNFSGLNIQHIRWFLRHVHRDEFPVQVFHTDRIMIPPQMYHMLQSIF